MNNSGTLAKIKNLLINFIKWFFCFFGILTFILLMLSFTDIPYYAYHNLATANPGLKTRPDLIVIPGGAGMPSPDGLIRTFYGAEAANQFGNAKIIIALPYNNGNDSLYQLHLMANELIVRGVDSSRIEFEPLGFNTRSQAINIAKRFNLDKENLSILIVTTPEHMYRTIKTFQKVGFANVGGMPAFEDPVDESKLESEEEMKDINLSFRYNMWSYLNYELQVLREYIAIAYYKIRGWI